MNEFEFYKKRDVGQMLQDLIRFYLVNFRELVNINLPFAIIITIFTYVYMDEFLREFTPEDLSTFSGFADFDFGSIFLVMLASLIATLFQIALNIEYVILKMNKVQFSFKSVYAYALHNFYKYIIWSIFAVMLLIILFLIGFIPLIGWFIFFYSMVAITPLFYVLRIEHLNFFDAVKECFRLIKDKWWLTFGTLFIFAVLYSILSMAISLILAGIFGVNVFSPESFDSNYFAVNAIGGLINNILGISMHFLPAFIYFTFSTKDKDLMNRISEIGED